MADEGATPEVKEEKPEEPRKEEPKDDAPLGKAGEKALEAFKQRAKDAEKQAKEFESRIKEFEDRDKSELEKLTGKVESLSSEGKTQKAENLRLRVALSKQLPAELVDRLKGQSQEEIETDADELLKLVGKQEPPKFDGGARETAAETKTPDQAHNDFLMTVFGKPNT